MIGGMITIFPFLTCIVCCQAAAAERVPPAASPAIEQAIANLSGASFSVRENAARELWGMGLQAEPALRAAAAEGSLETRQRASQILADFAYGITPDARPKVLRALRQYRAGAAETQEQILAAVTNDGDHELLAMLLQRTQNQAQREAAFSRSLESTELMTRLIEAGRLEWWLTEVGAGRYRRYPEAILAEWITAEGVIETLDRRGQLHFIEQAITQQVSGSERYLLLRRLLVQRTFVDFYSAPQYLDQLLGFIGTVETPKHRHELLLRLLSMTRETSFYQPPSLNTLLRFAAERGIESTVPHVWTYLLETMLSRDDVVSQLTVNQLKGFAAGLDEARFTRLIATLSESTAARRWSQEPAVRASLLEWAAQEQAPRRQTQLTRWLASQPAEPASASAVEPPEAR